MLPVDQLSVTFCAPSHPTRNHSLFFILTHLISFSYSQLGTPQNASQLELTYTMSSDKTHRILTKITTFAHQHIYPAIVEPVSLIGCQKVMCRISMFSRWTEYSVEPQNLSV